MWIAEGERTLWWQAHQLEAGVLPRALEGVQNGSGDALIKALYALSGTTQPCCREKCRHNR
jgi:hypothetical protein